MLRSQRTKVEVEIEIEAENEKIDVQEALDRLLEVIIDEVVTSPERDQNLENGDPILVYRDLEDHAANKRSC